jgi:hypothetical protein
MRTNSTKDKCWKQYPYPVRKGSARKFLKSKLQCSFGRRFHGHSQKLPSNSHLQTQKVMTPVERTALPNALSRTCVTQWHWFKSIIDRSNDKQRYYMKLMGLSRRISELWLLMMCYIDDKTLVPIYQTTRFHLMPEDRNSNRDATRLECLHRSPASRKRRRKGNPGTRWPSYTPVHWPSRLGDSNHGVIALQTADQSSRKRGRPTEARVTSSRVGSTRRHTDWLTVSRKVTSTSTSTSTSNPVQS